MANVEYKILQETRNGEIKLKVKFNYIQEVVTEITEENVHMYPAKQIGDTDVTYLREKAGEQTYFFESDTTAEQIKNKLVYDATYYGDCINVD